jgi:heme exporter protein B
MKLFFGPIFAIFWKDVLLETRTKDLVSTVLVFSLLVMVIFNFAIDPTPQIIGLVAPGILWIAFVFGGILGFGRSFTIENQGKSFLALLLSPISREQIFWGKVLTNLFMMLIVEMICLPIFVVLFNISFDVLLLLPYLLLATIGIATLGTLFSAMAVNTRSREVMLPILFLPVVIPVIIAGVEASTIIMGGGQFSEALKWIPFLVAVDAIFLVLSPIAFNIIVQD